MILSPIIFLLPVAVLSRSVPINDDATRLIDAPFAGQVFDINTPQEFKGRCRLEKMGDDINVTCNRNEETDDAICMRAYISEIGVLSIKSVKDNWDDCPSFNSELFQQVENIARDNWEIKHIKLLFVDVERIRMSTATFNAIFNDKIEFAYSDLGFDYPQYVNASAYQESLEIIRKITMKDLHNYLFESIKMQLERIKPIDDDLRPEDVDVTHTSEDFKAFMPEVTDDTLLVNVLRTLYNWKENETRLLAKKYLRRFLRQLFFLIFCDSEIQGALSQLKEVVTIEKEVQESRFAEE